MKHKDKCKGKLNIMEKQSETTFICGIILKLMTKYFYGKVL
jgi:hypothetical protein